MRGKLLPVLDCGLVFKELIAGSIGGRFMDQYEYANLVYKCSFPQEFFSTPFGEHSELQPDKTYLARSSPDNSRSSAEGYQLVQFLFPYSVSTHLGIAKEELTAKLRCRHLSTNTSSSSASGICKAMSEGRTMAKARTTRRMSFLSNWLFRREMKRNV
jgi:hypothetical protein